MKKIYSATLLVLSVLFSYHEITAQPTLTNSNTSPQIGESILIHSINTTGVNEGNFGANVTWDFSGLSSIGTTTITWIQPSTTPYASSFPNSNICFESGGSYDYYFSSSTEYGRQGAVSGGVIIAYSDPQVMISYPCSFGTTFTDYFASTFISGGTTFYRSGNITVTADAYGTLILPYDTISDVIRLKAVESYQDSAYIGSPFLIYYDSEIYIWYKPGTHYAIMSLTSFTSSITGPIKYGSYMDQTSVGIYETVTSELDYKTYPNPASTFINISYLIEDPSNVRISLTSLLGQEIKIFMNKKQESGSYIQTINLEDLDEGVYLMWIEINGNIETKKITIIK